MDTIYVFTYASLFLSLSLQIYFSSLPPKGKHDKIFTRTQKPSGDITRVQNANYGQNTARSNWNFGKCEEKQKTPK